MWIRRWVDGVLNLFCRKSPLDNACGLWHFLFVLELSLQTGAGIKRAFCGGATSIPSDRAQEAP